MSVACCWLFFGMCIVLFRGCGWCARSLLLLMWCVAVCCCSLFVVAVRCSRFVAGCLLIVGSAVRCWRCLCIGLLFAV